MSNGASIVRAPADDLGASPFAPRIRIVTRSAASSSRQPPQRPDGVDSAGILWRAPFAVLADGMAALVWRAHNPAEQGTWRWRVALTALVLSTIMANLICGWGLLGSVLDGVSAGLMLQVMLPGIYRDRGRFGYAVACVGVVANLMCMAWPGLQWVWLGWVVVAVIGLWRGLLQPVGREP